MSACFVVGCLSSSCVRVLFEGVCLELPSSRPPGACGPRVPWRGLWTRSAGSMGSGGSGGSADGFIFAHFSCFLQYFVIRTFQNHCKVVHFQFQRATLTVNGEGQCQKHIVKFTFSIPAPKRPLQARHQEHRTRKTFQNKL